MKQEIINLVDKIVGKKDIMRSPAWWVNRIFKKTLDYTDKVTKDAESRANAKIDALEASKEDKIMTVYVPKILEDTYQPWMTEENKRFYEEVEAGRCYICKIAAMTGGGAVYMTGNPIWLINTVFVSALYYFTTSNDLPSVTFQLITIDSDGNADLSNLYCNLLYDTRLKTINKQSLIGSGNIEIGAEVVDNLESESTTAALSANQGRVLNEKISQQSADNGVRIYELPLGLSYAFSQDGEYTFTDEEAARFNDVCDTWRDYHYIVILIIQDIDGLDSDSLRGYGRSYPTDVFCDSGYMRIQWASPSASDDYMACNNIKIEKTEDGAVIALPV